MNKFTDFNIFKMPQQTDPFSLRDKLYGVLCGKFRSGELLPGSVIDQKQVCTELNISRTPLTNALIRLEAEGIVRIHPRSRVVVNRLEMEDIQYLYEVIGAIEGVLIFKGFSNYTDDILDQMEECNRQMTKHIQNNDLQAYDPLHYRFHQVFVLMARNMFAERILIPIKSRLWDYPKKSFPMQWYLDACTEHQSILDALREKNVDKAVSYLKHIHWDFEFNKNYIQKTYYF